MKTVTASLSFDGNCRQAMSFYRECLATELELNPYPDASGQPSADPGAKIMHAQLVRGRRADPDGVRYASGRIPSGWQ